MNSIYVYEVFKLTFLMMDVISCPDLGAPPTNCLVHVSKVAACPTNNIVPPRRGNKNMKNEHIFSLSWKQQVTSARLVTLKEASLKSYLVSILN